MTKNEFISFLEKRLIILNEKERTDILNEYSQHIDMKIKSGLSEEEAVKDFGDISEIADEILNAYNVNADYNTESVGEKIKNGTEYIKKSYNKIKSNKSSSTLNIIIKIILLCIRVSVFMFLLPYLFVYFFTLVSMGALIVFSIAGYPCIGLTIGCLGVNMCETAIFAVIIKLVYFTKFKFGGVDNEITEN